MNMIKKDQYTQKDKQRLLAVEMLSINPSLTQKDLALKLGVDRTTIIKWCNDPLFIDAWYKRFMEVAGGELPNVVLAMIREAKEGNVQAGRLILEHFGKLDTRVKIQVESPFERFLQQGKQIEGAIVVEEEAELKELLPPKESKQQVLNQQKKDSKKLMQRAKKVGLKPLGKGRHTKTAKKNWIDKLEALESKNLPTQ